MKLRVQAVALSCLLFASTLGCQHNRGLVELMAQNGFVPFTPPTTGWEVGEAVLLDRSSPGAVQAYFSPSDAGQATLVQPGVSPDVSSTDDGKYNLDFGLTVPDAIKVQLKANNVSRYSLVTSGNSIENLKIGGYPQVLTAMLNASGGMTQWKPFIDKQEMHYLSRLWSVTSLSYKFYDENGGEIKVEPQKVKIEGSLAADWKVTQEGSLTYAGTKPLYIGYDARPVLASGAGVMPGGIPGLAPGSGPSSAAALAVARDKPARQANSNAIGRSR